MPTTQFIYAGGAVFHANRPILSFYDNTNKDYQVYPRYVFHGGGNIDVNTRTALLPNFIYMRMGPYQQLTFGSFIKYNIDGRRKSESAFLTGLWLRGLKLEDGYSLDAFIAAIRLDYKAFTFTFTYDINVSSLAAASYGRGGPELSIIYTLGKPSVKGSTYNGILPFKNKHKIKCPYF